MTALVLRIRGASGNATAKQRCFAVAAPGLEPVVASELTALGIVGEAEVGGVAFDAPWDALLPLNRRLAVASRILVRFANFKCVHLSELVRATKRLPWAEVLRPGVPVRVKATCRKSKIYHSGAAAQRVREGIAHVVSLSEEVPDGEAGQEVLVRIERDMCEISLNSSGEHLHRRGYKLQTAKAPLRETLGAGILRLCQWTPDEALIDPMCGSGTFPIEAALAAAQVWPGRARSFACEAWPVLKCARAPVGNDDAAVVSPASPRIWGYDRDAGAIASTRANAERAGVLPWLTLNCQPLAALQAPPSSSGLAVCNPPWGERVGERRALRNLYATLGRIMRTTLPTWRLALLTTQTELAHATGLEFAQVSEPLLHGGLRVRLYQTQLP